MSHRVDNRALLPLKPAFITLPLIVRICFYFRGVMLTTTLPALQELLGKSGGVDNRAAA